MLTSLGTRRQLLFLETIGKSAFFHEVVQWLGDVSESSCEHLVVGAQSL
jgi:hypothetical protein